MHHRDEIQEKLGGNVVIQGNGEIFIRNNVLSAGFSCLNKHWTDIEKRPNKVILRIFKDQTEEPAFFGTVKTTTKCVRMAKILKREEFFKLTNCIAKNTGAYYTAMNCLQSGNTKEDF